MNETKHSQQDNEQREVVIVGGGVSGLYTAWLLTKRGIPCRVIEARDRLGGRVWSKATGDGRFDLGATWFWPSHEQRVRDLCDTLGLKTFAQHEDGLMRSERSSEEAQSFSLPPSEAPSWRIEGGMGALVDALAERLPMSVIELNTSVTRLEKTATGVGVETWDGRERMMRQAAAVVLALPPRVTVRDVTFDPPLSEAACAWCEETPTWMAGQAKIVVRYDEPFWRAQGYSGFATSWVGPLQEIHDASSEKGGALMGFVGVPADVRHRVGRDVLLEASLQQLVRLFGEEAGEARELLYHDWSLEKETATVADAPPLREFPVYGAIPPTPEWVGLLFHAGTETSAGHGGHVEGALASAERAVQGIVETWSKRRGS